MWPQHTASIHVPGDPERAAGVLTTGGKIGNNRPEGVRGFTGRTPFFLPSFDSSDIREDEAKQQSKKEEQAAAHPSVRAPVSVCTRGLEVKNNESP